MSQPQPTHWSCLGTGCSLKDSKPEAAAVVQATKFCRGSSSQHSPSYLIYHHSAHGYLLSSLLVMNNSDSPLRGKLCVSLHTVYRACLTGRSPFCRKPSLPELLPSCPPLELFLLRGLSFLELQRWSPTDPAPELQELIIFQLCRSEI